MAIPTYNPYKEANTLFTDGLDYIIANLPTDATFDDVVTQIRAYFDSLPNPPDDTKVFENISYNSANDYINTRIAQNLNFGANEWAFIDAVLQGIKENGIESLADFFTAAQEQLAEAEINTATKTSLYAALGLTKASYAYWVNIVGTPGDWADYINTNAAINYANIPNWVSATFVSALSGYAQVQSPGIGQSDMFITQGRLTAINTLVAAALAVSAGKVIVKWARRPVIGCGCNS